jgi:uncharacterized NAD(P)/FAD-binding protein YdhS
LMSCGPIRKAFGDCMIGRHRRALRHARPWWDVHRHRLAPPVARRIAEMEQAGRLRFVAGRIVGAHLTGQGQC